MRLIIGEGGAWEVGVAGAGGTWVHGVRRPLVHSSLNHFH